MLDNLHVRNLALIEEEDISFGPGFNILTGETGAGKSIILGSVNLALGAKLNSDVIRSGADSALIELSFSLSEEEASRIAALGYDISEERSLLLSRKILPGKSISRINGETISLGELRKVGEILLDMYGQHENQSLLKSATYAGMLDEYAGQELYEYKEELKGLLERYKDILSSLSDENSDTDVRKREMDLLSFEIKEIEDAAIKEGEDEELEERFRFLSNAGRIMEASAEAHALTGYDGEYAAGSLIGSALGKLKNVSSYDEGALQLCEELTEVESLLNDFVRSLSGYEEGLEFDEEELSLVSERLDLLNTLKAKYGGSLSSVLASFSEKEKEYERLSNYEEYLDGLKKEEASVHKDILSKCEKISDLRRKAAKPLASKLTETLKDLNFEEVKLEVNITPDENNIRESGYDDIEFLISLNVGENLKKMTDVSSGGELSRIMLAFKSVFASRDGVSTLIFDEIDTGISGRTAHMVAEKMNELSKDHQIICITHLPQIAAMADDHYLIEKSVSDGRTLTHIEHLDEEGSVRELARMLGASDITEEALLNARGLKKRG